ncbi:MAG TPA: nuclear transport factor 2 family protein [Chloroflexota bacterium]|nr:nuclear transport factor 2 family protein [Chloroflexota bacterium]
MAVIPDGEKVAPLFAEDGVVELPFLHSVGIEPRCKGRAAIVGFYDVVKQLYPDLVFKSEDMHVLIETPDQVFAEHTAHTKAAAAGRRINMFAGCLVAEGRKIKVLRESLNVIAAAKVLLPRGVGDLPRPFDCFGR